MSQTASFLTDFVFPGLLICCGLLGLGVVNALGNQPPQTQTKASKSEAPSITAQPMRRRPPVSVRPAKRIRPTAQPRIASLRPKAVTKHAVAFGKRQSRVKDAERERLRVFLAAAKPGPESKLSVVGYGAGRRGQKRALKRAQRVVALLRQLGVAAASIAPARVAAAEAGTGGLGVTIVIGKQ